MPAPARVPEPADVAAMPSDIVWRASDGFELHGTWYAAACAAPLGGVLIAPAFGVPQRFYAKFARWLASQGYAVLSFDYRGVGASRPETHRRSLRGFEADITHWATLDAESALLELRARLPQGSPLHWLGHSLGGQIVGMVPSRHRLHSVTTIACGSGYWRQNALGLRWRAPLLWHVIAPLAMTVSGYFPGRRLGMIGDLPLQAMRRWRSWCLQPDYFMADPAMNADDALRRQYAALRMPLLSLSFADDEYMSARNIDALHGYYARATRTMRRITSQDVGGQRVGHFGFFRETFRESLWPQLPVWWSRLDSTSNAAQP